MRRGKGVVGSQESPTRVLVANKGNRTNADKGKCTPVHRAHSGNDTEWREWKEKFLAQACLQGYRDILHGSTKAPPEKKEELTDTEQFAQDCNLRTYSDLILCCTGIPFSLVENAKTKEHPCGDAALAWKRLKEKFEVETAASRVC